MLREVSKTNLRTMEFKFPRRRSPADAKRFQSRGEITIRGEKVQSAEFRGGEIGIIELRLDVADCENLGMSAIPRMGNLKNNVKIKYRAPESKYRRQGKGSRMKCRD